MKTFSILFGLLALAALLSSILDENARHQFILFLIAAIMSLATWEYGKIEKAKK